MIRHMHYALLRNSWDSFEEIALLHDLITSLS